MASSYKGGNGQQYANAGLGAKVAGAQLIKLRDGLSSIL
jgi:hypothetical protein